MLARQPLDRDYRAFLIRTSPPAIRGMFTECFNRKPLPPSDAMEYLGFDTKHPMLLSTVPVVEECDRYMPGLSAWLVSSRYGNDLGMIKAFAAWYEHGLSREQIAARQHH